MNWQKLLDESVSEIRRIAPPSRMRDPEQYAYWLSQTYHFVRHSTSLLGYALPFLHDDKLRAVFEHHLGEESRHDLLAIKDIEMLCLKLSPPSAFTEAFYQSQYYKIQFEGGKSLLGYILFLENLAVTWGKEMYRELETVHPRSLVFLKVHAEEDVSHVARAVSLIERQSNADQDKIAANFRSSWALYSSLLEHKVVKQQRFVA